MALLEETSRVAFAALIHDLGKFAQRAEIPAGKDRIETHKQWYCPRKRQTTPPYLPLNEYTRVHAAYTALGFDAIEKACGFDLRGEQSPFDPSNTRTPNTDSLVNAAARHHKPETLLQWIVATADRVASGFERDQKLPAEEEGEPDRPWSFITRRKVSLLEEIRLDESFRGDFQYRKPLEPFSVASLFPKLKKEAEPADKQQAVDQYRKLWEGFLEGCQKLGDRELQGNWPLWLDAFDTLWLTYTESIPSATAFGVRSDVSLYDHSKATAALAAALWRWCRAQGRSDKELIADLRSVQGWDKESLLLIQGDFFGIQNFIFSSGSQTDAKSAKILRGRSFYVSLLTEACALRILEALDLPSTSQITNAAGKFLIVAPNTEDVRAKLDAVRTEVDAWFLKHTFGESGIGIAAKRATLANLVEKEFPQLIKSLFEELEVAKLRRFDLFGEGEHPQVLQADFSKGVCAWQGRWPADKEKDGLPSCAVSRDEILVGEALVKNDLLLLVKDEDERRLSDRALELPLFGYKAVFADGETEFHQIRLKTDVRRVWDFSIPEKEDEVLWKGFARRSINGFVPRVPEDVNPENHLTYKGLDRNELGGERIEPFSWIQGDRRNKAILG